MSLQENIVNVAGSTNAIKVTAVYSVGAGAAQTFFEWIPDDIGKFASLAGIISLMVPLFFAWKRHKLESEKMRLEIEQLKADQSK